MAGCASGRCELSDPYDVLAELDAKAVSGVRRKPMETTDRVQSLLERVPTSERAQAAALIAEYGPALLDLAVADAWAYLRRIQAGDIEAVHELLTRGSDDAFLAAVRANSARWQGVADAELARAKLAQDIALKAAPIVLSILLAIVGL